MSASEACEGRRPWPWRRRSRPGRRRGTSGPAGRTGEPTAPSLAASRAVATAASGRPGCAASLRAALAHGPLRNRQRRGFPRGGSLAATITHSLLRRASQNGGAHGAGGGRSPAPFCARREICQRGKPPPRVQLTGKPAGGSRARGDHVTRCRRRTPPPPPALRPLGLLEGKPPRPRG